MRGAFVRLLLPAWLLFPAGHVTAGDTESGNLNVSGAIRARWESLDNQYRVVLSGDDHVLALRSSLKAEYRTGRFAIVGELLDSRSYFDGDGTPLLAAGLVNTTDLLQAYAEFDTAPGGAAASSSLRLGRFTLDIASRRFVQRNRFRNTINSFTGAHWHRVSATGAIFDMFYTLPVRRLPVDRPSLADNDFEADKEDRSRRFWGMHLQRPGLFGPAQADAFLYGLHEKDRGNRPTADRELYMPGFRIYAAPRPGGYDLELETAYSFGHRSETIANQAEKLDIRAGMLHAEVGYTFSSDWSPRVSLEYDYASGDKPGNGNFERFESPFGNRRGDLGNTSIYGPLARSNISAPGIRLEFSKGRTDGAVLVQKARLAEARDFWVAAGLRDPSGSSGRTLGTTLDFRVRYWLEPSRLRLETGGSGLWYGRFPREVPGGPGNSRTLYGYVQLEYFFGH